MKRTDHPITAIDSRRAWDCPWYGVRQDRIRLPNGDEGVYNVVEMDDSVWIVPITTAGEVVLLYHYRYPLGRWIWELPAGHIEPGEDPQESARRELLEETGGSAASWQRLIRVSTMKGIGTEHALVYLATDVTLGETDHEPVEVMTVHTFPLAEALRMARSGEIDDAVGVMGLLLAADILTQQRTHDQP